MAYFDAAGSSSPLSSAPPSPPTDSSASDDSGLSERSVSPPLEHPDHPNFRPDTRRAYPSPSSSQRSSAKASPVPETMATPPSSNDGDGRPRKKRKLVADPKQPTAADPKARPTERLDLTHDIDQDQMPQLERLLKVLHKKRKIVVIAGAGISVSAGIPDFRSSSGLFNSLRKEHKLKSSGKDLFDASVYQDDSSTSSFHDMVRSLSQQTKTAQPTAFHHLLATLAHEGRLLRLYTQNVDGIDTSLPPLNTQVPLPKKGPWPKTVQLHGGLGHMVCSKCHSLSEFDAEQFNGPVPPACENCMTNDAVRAVAEKRSHGIGRLRPRMVLYNEHNPDDEAIGSCASLDLRTRPDAIIVAGTTLKVPGVRRIAREMCAIVRDRKDGVAIWINNDPEPIGKDLANSWDLIVKGPCDEVARHAAMRRWDDPIVYKEVTAEDLIKTKEKQRADVVVVGTPRKRTAVEQVQGQMLTPIQSPRVAPQDSINLEPLGQPSFLPAAKGTKRNFDATTKKPTKAKPRQTQPKKATGAKGKAKNNNTASIANSFKATKSNIKKADGKKSNIKFVQPYKKNNQEAPRATKENHQPNDVVPKREPSTPTGRRVSGALTGIKGEYRYSMALVSSSASRTNAAPPSPEMEPFTPIKGGVPGGSPSEQLWSETQARQSRPSTAVSQRGPLNSATILN
ncbi:DHS-like NAD/FAD-binding domain-containing protein [Melanomma pulvis-pyrius CBS 109.77]|uniref:DHS-like NAD/FAD-binding domain-containing protein n=1 Tax=Melanomma pulvis-pyrius CBS 109.77 TaxID=1314802 RepID=A0A6A6XN88_9PLEO|nr:DHS-like NAD/FAD-binding domain-containing protein [Melanomma pulvis-pyrius CBS 109.77]